MRRMQGLIAGAMLSLALSSHADAVPGVVRIDSGELEGVVAGEIVSFKNVPFAAPPIGNLRWRAPQPVAAWSGVRKADKVGALCMQKINPTDNGVGPPPASEDCLTLNVFAPVKRNIAAFGGDASNVTIFGESAGGAAVNTLMIAPPARGLFHKSISQSGLGRERRLLLDRSSPEGRPSALEAGAKFAERMGAANADAAALRALSADAIIKATEQFADTNPIIDGKLIPENVDAAFAAGRQAPVPYLAGSNALEFPFYSESMPGAIGEAMRFSAEQRAQLVTAYGGEDNYKTNILSDVLFTEPARALTRLHLQSKQPSYLYRFSVLSTHAPPTIKATPHAQERQHVFKTLETSAWKTDANDERASELMSAYWVAFAKTGNPNGGSRPEWPLATTDNRVFEFTNDGPIVTQQPNAAALDTLAKRY